MGTPQGGLAAEDPSDSPLLCFGGVPDSIAAAAKKILQSNYSKHSATVTRGKGGLGMAIEHEGASHLAAVRVGHLIAGKPVAESGLVKEGDLVSEINGHSTLGKSFDEIVDMLGGKAGDECNLQLRRCDVKQTATWKSDSEKNWFVGEDVTFIMLPHLQHHRCSRNRHTTPLLI